MEKEKLLHQMLTTWGHDGWVINTDFGYIQFFSFSINIDVVKFVYKLFVFEITV